MPRRHFGSIRKLGNKSGRYQARFFHAGVYHNGPHTFATKADANAWLSNVETDLQRGVWVNQKTGKIPLRTYATEWLARRPDLKPSTRAKYQHLIDKSILPWRSGERQPRLGDRELSALQPSVIRGWWADLATDHPSTAADSYRLLSTICNTAVADQVIARSPCQVKGASSSRSTERPVASVAEVTAAAEAMPERLRLAPLLAAWCQLRRGEVLGLQRRDVNPLRGTLRVERAWSVPPGKAPVLGEPKTEAGRRTLSIPANVLPAIQSHLDRHVGPLPDDWLFGTANGTAVAPRNLLRAWNKARQTIGRPDLHLHDLRHSGLTWAAASGASVAELMRRGGHASPAAAIRYQHATEDRDKALAQALASLAIPAD